MNKGLKFIHSLNICHGDIKSQNVMWSNEKNKMIFIDFGLSRIVKENIGETTVTRFVGTFCNVSPQMQKTYRLNKGFWVDLYYNDLWGLEQLLKKF